MHCSTRVSLSIIFLHCYVFYAINAIDPTCRGKRVGETCRSDEDCEGPYYQCLDGRCVCPPDFEEYTLSDKLKICRPARTNVDDKCESKCKDPLLCKDGKCVCFKGTVSGNKCYISCPAGQTLVGQECRALATSVNGKCSDDIDCGIPNSYCNNGKCDCVPGAQRSGSYCILTCPDGTAPTQACKKILVNDANAAANADKQDTCPRGYGCFTWGKPDIGHCCRLYCPYGSADWSKSCSAGASSSEKCPEQSTHYCQTFESHGAKNSLCCPRPCREPTPLYINGACLPNAHWGDACKEDGQCEGGATMRCSDGRCQCKDGYKQVNDTFATCQKPCLLQAQVDGGQCKAKVGVGDSCLNSAMCPLKSICREGICQCDCSSALSAGKCVNPDDPLGIETFLNNFGSIIGTGSKPIFKK